MLRDRARFSRILNAITLLVLITAAWLAWQPGSLLRTKWEDRRSNAVTPKATRKIWSRMAVATVPIYDSEGDPHLVEVLDYECVFCRQVASSVDSAVDGGTRVAILLVPRPSSTIGQGAALATICAEQVGLQIAMHRRLIHTIDWQSDRDWEREARAVGVRDINKFRTCMRSDDATERLRFQRALADSLELTAIPAFFSQTSVIHGTLSTAEIIGMSKPNDRE